MDARRCPCQLPDADVGALPPRSNQPEAPRDPQRPVLGAERHVSYRIEDIHVFESNGCHYAWSPTTRAASELSPPIAELLRSGDGRTLTFDEIERGLGAAIPRHQVRQLLAHLQQNGFLARLDKQCTPVSSLNLILTTHCNMDCIYCYGGKGRHENLPGGSYNLAPRHMQPEIGFLAVDYLLKAAALTRARTPGSINFFGGEPLLNQKTMQAVMDYADRQAEAFGVELPRFSITTNGTLLRDAFIALFRKFDVAVQVSFDGTPDAQNINRPFRRKAGESSYESCRRAFRTLRDEGIAFRVRATISRHNTDILRAIEHLDELGVSHVHFAIANMHDSFDGGLSEQDIDELLIEYAGIADYMFNRIRGGKRYVRCTNLTGLVSTLHSRKEKSFCCGAGIGLLSVVPDGRLFLCHRFAGEDAFCVGHIRDGIGFSKRRDLIERMHINTHQECRACWCRDICGGGCPYSNYLHGNTLSTPDPVDCKLQRGLAEIAIGFAARVRRESEEHYRTLVG